MIGTGNNPLARTRLSRCVALFCTLINRLEDGEASWTMVQYALLGWRGREGDVDPGPIGTDRASWIPGIPASLIKKRKRALNVRTAPIKRAKARGTRRRVGKMMKNDNASHEWRA
jgi:hypothetical protein